MTTEQKEFTIGLQEGLESRFWVKVEKTDTCWIWIGGTSCFGARKDRRGYGRFYVRGKNRKAHRVSWMAAGRIIPEGMSILHHCDNPLCVNPDHLYVGTQAQNVQDMHQRKRHPGNHQSGEDHPMAKIREQDAIEIKASLERNSRLALKFGVSKAAISLIKTGKRWRNI